MKTLIFTSIFLLLTSFAFGQIKYKTNDKFYLNNKKNIYSYRVNLEPGNIIELGEKDGDFYPAKFESKNRFMHVSFFKYLIPSDSVITKTAESVQEPTPTNENLYQFLKLENSQIFFEKIYQIDSLPLSEVEKLLLNNVPRVVTDMSKTTDLIVARIYNIYIDYKKYGGKWSGTLLHLNHPFFADVSIVWKEGKYKVTVSNMSFQSSSLGTVKCTSLFTNYRSTDLDTKPIIVTGGRYIEKYLADLFLFKPVIDDEW